MAPQQEGPPYSGCGGGSVPLCSPPTSPERGRHVSVRVRDGIQEPVRQGSHLGVGIWEWFLLQLSITCLSYSIAGEEMFLCYKILYQLYHLFLFPAVMTWGLEKHSSVSL